MKSNTCFEHKKYEPKTLLYNELCNVRFGMHDSRNGKYTFVLNGLYCYCPNRSSSSGHGSDSFYFNCQTDEGNSGILEFTESAEYGAGWFFSPISEEEASSLSEEMDYKEWGRITNRHVKESICRLHPDEINLARKLIMERSLKTGELTDEKLYG